MMNKDKKEWFDLPTIKKHDNDFKDKKFDKKMALGLFNEVQVNWCGDCDNYKHSCCGCYFPNFKKEMIKKIDEHFELLDGIQTIINKAKELSDSNDELKGLYFITPYKLEDLKEDMWVYDGIEKLICQIGLISKNAIHREYVDGTISDSPFEENRFYPPQMANIINIKKENKKTMKAIINFYGNNSIEYNLELVDIRCDDRYVYVATNNNEGVAFPKEDVESIEITKF